MTKRYAEGVFKCILEHLPEQRSITGVSLYLSKGMLMPRVTYNKPVEIIENEDGTCISESSGFMGLDTDKQLTIKQLVKLLAVWEECVIKEKE